MKNPNLKYLAAAALMATSSAMADTIIDTRPANSAIYSFGETDTASYGQTFTVPLVDSQLDSFTLSAALGYGDATEFAFYVMAWDGFKATGPVLYASPAQVVNSASMTDFTFNPGISLTPGGSYVGFVNTSSFFDNDGNSSSMASVGGSDAYAGGLFVFLNHGSDFSKVTEWNWAQNWQGPGYDLAFEARFSSPAVPDAGTTLSMLGVGLLLLGQHRRRAC